MVVVGVLWWMWVAIAAGVSGSYDSGCKCGGPVRGMWMKVYSKQVLLRVKVSVT